MEIEEQTKDSYAGTAKKFGIQKWDTKSLIDHFTMIIYARRRSGKSFLVQRVISDNRKRYDEIYFFSNTADIIPKTEYAFVPPENKYTTLETEVIEKILNDQKALLFRNKNLSKKEQIPLPKILIILDDIITDPKFMKQNGIVTKLFVEGRHSHISLVVIAQAFTGRNGISPVIRKNSDYLISFFNHSEVDAKGFSEQYLSLESTKTGISLLKDITSTTYQAIIVDVTKTDARKYSDYVKTYIAPSEPLDKFQIGGIQPTKSQQHRLSQPRNSTINLNTKSNAVWTQPLFDLRLKKSEKPPTELRTIKL